MESRHGWRVDTGDGETVVRSRVRAGLLGGELFLKGLDGKGFGVVDCADADLQAGGDFFGFVAFDVEVEDLRLVFRKEGDTALQEVV